MADVNFVVSPAERLFAPLVSKTRAARIRFAGLFALCLLLNVTVLFGLLYEAFRDSADVMIAEEIPVEVMVEPPAAPQPETPPEPPPQQAEQEKPKPPEPPPRQQALDEQPATDAPRAENKQEVEREAADKASQAPKQAPPSEQAAAAPAPDKGASPAQEPNPQPKPPQDKPEMEKSDSETVEDTAATPTVPPWQQPPAPAAQPKKGAMSMAELTAAFETPADFLLDSAAGSTPVAGGNAKSTYLTILYGMIMPHMQAPPASARRPRQNGGLVVFYIDPRGNLVHQSLARASGSPELDAAAIAAVRRAAPFPPPPNHQPISLTFSYGAH